MNVVATAISVAEEVLGRPCRDIHEYDVGCVRGLAAYLVYSTGRMSWQTVANNVYGVGASHRRALEGAKRWAGTGEAQEASALFEKRREREVRVDVWSVIDDIQGRIEKLEAAHAQA